MNGLLLLIPVALFLGAVGLGAFIWSLRSGQYDDLDGAALRILEDDDDRPAAARRVADKGRPGNAR
jgi:cbb3-type cytochrome oxidase maturation protein